MNVIGSNKIYTAMASADRFWQMHKNQESEFKDTNELV